MFKHEGVYFMLTSACSGWNPNRAEVFYARSGEQPPPACLHGAVLPYRAPCNTACCIDARGNMPEQRACTLSAQLGM